MHILVETGAAGILPEERLYMILLACIVIVTVAGMFAGYYFRRMDDPDCSKFAVFNHPHDQYPAVEDENLPTPPLSCRLRYLEDRSLMQVPGVNTSWFWITLGLILAWVAMITYAFALTHGMTIRLQWA